LTLGRGGLSGLSTAIPAAVVRTMNTPAPTPTSAGPKWFLRMDRNRDGDISRREFLGSRAQFSRLDRDKDDLIDPSEAAAVTTTSPARPVTTSAAVAAPGGK